MKTIPISKNVGLFNNVSKDISKYTVHSNLESNSLKFKLKKIKGYDKMNENVSYLAILGSRLDKENGEWMGRYFSVSGTKELDDCKDPPNIFISKISISDIDPGKYKFEYINLNRMFIKAEKYKKKESKLEEDINTLENNEKNLNEEKNILNDTIIKLRDFKDEGNKLIKDFSEIGKFDETRDIGSESDQSALNQDKSDPSLKKNIQDLNKKVKDKLNKYSELIKMFDLGKIDSHSSLLASVRKVDELISEKDKELSDNTASVNDNKDKLKERNKELKKCKKLQPLIKRFEEALENFNRKGV